MSNIFIILLLASIAGAIVGTIKPSLIRFQSRVRVLLVFLGASLLFLILIAFTLKPSSNIQASVSAQPAQATNTPAVDPDAAQKAQIQQIVNDVPANGKYLGTGTISKVDVYHVPNLNDASKYIGWGVDVDLHIDGSRAVMNEEMGEIYYALYSSRKNFTSVAVSVYESTTDKYGNQKETEVYHTFLKADEASKVNWSLDHDSLVYSVLPKLWTVNLDLSVNNPDLLQK